MLFNLGSFSNLFFGAKKAEIHSRFQLASILQCKQLNSEFSQQIIRGVATLYFTGSINCALLFIKEYVEEQFCNNYI
jgi:hypothetical protein